MEVLFSYLIKSTLYVIAFYAVYCFFLRKETFYRFNRFFLLLGVACSLVLPLITFNYNVALPVAYSNSQVTTTGTAVVSSSWLLVVVQFLFFAYLFVTFFLVLRQFFGLWKLKKLANNYNYVIYQGCRLITTTNLASSFSVGNYIFLATPAVTSVQEKELILQHEIAHVKQYHWADLLFLQLYCALQWFNPFAWLYLKAIRENHEFLADQAVLANGNSPASYRAALINHSLKVPVFVFASPFLGNSRFNRLKMMYKSSSSPIKQWSVLWVTPLVLAVLFAFAEPEYVIVNNQKQSLLSQTKGRTEVIGYKKEKLITKNKTASTKVKASLTHLPTGHAADPKAKIVVKSVGRNVEVPTKEDAAPMLLVNGIESHASIKELISADIESINILKNEAAILKFGAKAQNGVIEVILKKVHANELEVKR